MTEEPREAEPLYRAEASDLLFGYLLAIAVSIGLTPLLPDQAALRYTLSYAILMGFGALAWVLGKPPTVDEAPRQLLRGFLVGLVIGLPFYFIGGSGLRATVERLFPALPPGAVLAYALFIITPAETLFFRARAQRYLAWFLVPVLSTVWCLILFLPFYFIGGSGLRATVERLFPALPPGAVLAYALFIITPAETLFFRARAQRYLAWFLVPVLSTVWCLILFLPLLEPLRYPYPTTVIAVAIVTMNVLFSDLCRRSGLVAAFVSQSVAYSFLLFFPTLSA